MYGRKVTTDTSLKNKYIVWSPEASVPSQIVFNDRPEAIKAAYAMAGRHKGQRFSVCKIVGVAMAETVSFSDYESEG